MKKTFIYLFLLSIIIFLFRLLLIYKSNYFNFDEIVSLYVAKSSFFEMWQYLKWEMHPPLHYYYLHFWMQFFGTSVLAVKFSSLACSLLSGIFIYYLADLLFVSKRTAVYSSLFFSLSPLLNFYAVWGRMYSLLILLAILSYFFFIKIIKKDNHQSGGTADTIFFVLFSVCALFTHITAVAIPFTQLIYLIYLRHKDSSIKIALKKKFMLPFLAVIVVYLPWLIYFVYLRLHSLSPNAWYFFDQADTLFFFTSTLNFFVNINNAYLSNISLVIIILLLVLAFLKLDIKNTAFKIHTDSALVFSLIIFLLPMSLFFIFHLFKLRYLLVVSIGLFLLVGHAVSSLHFNRKIEIVAASAVILIMFPSLLSYFGYAAVDWGKIKEYIEINSDGSEKIITSEYNQLLSLQYYYNGSLSADAVLDDAARDENLLLTVIKTNNYASVTEGNVDMLERLTNGYNRIFLIYTNGDYSENQKLARDWLIRNKWQIVDQLKFESHQIAYDQPNILLLEKNVE